MPSKQGGFGFGDIEAFNDALLAKLSWRILKNLDSMLARVLLGKYYHNVSFMECKPPSAGSHGWHRIMVGNILLQQGMGRNIRDGKYTNIWTDPWLSLTEPKRAFGPPPEDTQELTILALILPNSNQWNEEVVKQTIPQHLSDVLRIVPSKTEVDDRSCWLPRASGLYTSRSGYWKTRELKPEINITQSVKDFPWKSDIWSLKTSPKIQLFLWKVIHEALPTKVNLAIRAIPSYCKCLRYGDPETLDHILFQCVQARSIWAQAPISHFFPTAANGSVGENLKNVKLCKTLPPMGLHVTPLYPWLCWVLWKDRNDLLFNNRSNPETEIIAKAILAAKEW